MKFWSQRIELSNGAKHLEIPFQMYFQQGLTLPRFSLYTCNSYISIDGNIHSTHHMNELEEDNIIGTLLENVCITSECRKPY